MIARVHEKISEPKVECKSLPKAERFQRLFIKGDPMTRAPAVIEKPCVVC